MTDQVTFRKGYMAADFLTDSYRISGEVDIAANALTDVLNDHLKTYIKLENVYISPIQNPADIKGHFEHGQLRKNNITMVILHREEDGLPKHQTYGSYIGQVVHDVFLTVPGFEVEGLLVASPRLNLERILVYEAQSFIPISEAVATVSLAPDIRFRGGMILVNRDHVGIFCMVGEHT